MVAVVFPHRSTLLALAALMCGQLAHGQTVINSTFVERPQWPPVYSDPNNWAPNGVPNDVDGRHYNVTINPHYFVMVDTNVTISNLTLGGSLPGLYVDGRNLTVTGTTANQMEFGFIDVQSYQDGAAVKFDAGTLTTFSNHVLSGEYTIAGISNPATLQFNGANISTLTNGSLSMFGAFSAVVDEFGNDALRNLARIESSGALKLYGRSVVTNAPFQNDGTLLVYNGSTPITFTAAAGLTNFDSSTRTITGGVFEMVGSDPAVELRFNGADIANLGSSIQLQGSNARVADMAGNDGLRNLAHILPGGKLWLLNHTRTIAEPFRNDGALSVEDYAVCVIPALANFDASTRTLSGGTFGIGTGSYLKFAGADIVHNASSITLSYGGTITDLAGNDGLRNFIDNLSSGEFTVGNSTQFTASGDFTNSGKVETIAAIFRIHQTAPEGRFIVPPGFGFKQTAGVTINNGRLTADHVDILGGTFSGSGIVQGNLTVENATFTPSDQTTIQGNLTLHSGSHFRYQFNFSDPKEVAGAVVVGGTLEVDIPSEYFLSSISGGVVLRSATSLTGTFSNAPNGARIPTVDGKGSVVISYGPTAVTFNGYQSEPPPSQMLDISARAFLPRSADDVTGDRAVLIAGFIVSGFTEKKDIILRGLGPSLSRFGLSSVLPDPVLELRSANGQLIASNDNWKDKQANEISGYGLAPQDDHESALLVTLSYGAYTALLREKNGAAGNGVVEVYDVSGGSAVKLANISARGYVDSNNVLIGGIIEGGDGKANDEVVVRALGPQLTASGVQDALDDPTLELRDKNGSLLAFNDDWTTNSDQLAYTGLAPSNNAESAMRVSLPSGSYTAIVRAKGSSEGVALVEFYDLRR
jgi:hypothetical protein